MIKIIIYKALFLVMFMKFKLNSTKKRILKYKIENL